MVINANAKPDGYQVKLVYVRFKRNCRIHFSWKIALTTKVY